MNAGGYSNIGTPDSPKVVWIPAGVDLQSIKSEDDYWQALRNHLAVQTKGNTTMAKNATTTTLTFDQFAADLRDLLDKYVGGATPTVSAPPEKAKAKPSKAVEPEPEEDEADEDDVRTRLEGLSLAALKKEAIAAGFDKADVKDADRETLIESLVDDAEASEEAEDEDAEEDETEEEDEASEYNRDELAELGLVALKNIAKNEFDQTTASLKGLDKEAVIDIIMGEEAEDEEEDEGEDEEEDEGLTEEALNEMSLAELKAAAKEYGIKIKPGMKRQQIVDAFFE